MMKKHDSDNDNLIDFDDFVKIFIKDPKELKKLRAGNESM
jgi:hypothetical protein